MKSFYRNVDSSSNLPSTDTEYLQQLPNGLWMDTRYKYGRGTRVRLIDGPDQGRLATVISCVFLQGTEDVPGYHLEFAKEEWVTVRWDWVEGLQPLYDHDRKLAKNSR